MRIPKDIPVYGDLNYRDKKGNKNEACEQIDVVSWLKVNDPEMHSLFIHPKNEGNRTGNQVTFERKMGSLTTGASDAIIPTIVPFVGELKQQDHTNSSISKDQLNYLRTAQKHGAFACIMLGLEGFKLAYNDWKDLNRRALEWLNTQK